MTGDDLALLLNNDAEMDESCLRTLLSHLAEHPEIGAIGPVLEENGRRCHGGRNPLFHIASRIVADAPASTTALIDVDYVPGTALLLRARALEEVGLLNERFFFSGEIADLCHRLRRAGWRCAIAPDAVARHAAEDAEGLRSTLYRYYTLRNRFLLAREQFPRGWPFWGLYWTAVGALMGMKACLRDREAARAVRWALLDGWSGRFGKGHERFLH